jgi:hypothetical protein
VFVHCQEFWIVENIAFQKLALFPSSGERRKRPTLLGPLERANLNHWTTRVIWQQLYEHLTQTEPNIFVLNIFILHLLGSARCQVFIQPVLYDVGCLVIEVNCM